MKRALVAILCLLALTLTVTNAKAASYLLAYGDAQYLGYFVPGGGDDASATSQTAYLNYILDMAAGSTDGAYTRVNSTVNTTGMDADVLDAFKTDTDFGPSFLVDSIEFVAAKYDGQNAGYLFWYLGNLNSGDTVSLMTNWDPDFPFATDSRRYGISNFTTWGGDGPPNIVPEPGTMVLLGVGMLGLAIFGKRRINRA